MRKALLFILFAFLQVPVFGQAKFVFEQTKIDLGNIEASKNLYKIEVKFKNEGDEPLTIDKVISSFPERTLLEKTTEIKYPQTPIAPGQNGVITIYTIFYYYESGIHKKSVTVHSSGLNKMSRIYIDFNVIPLPEIQ